MHSYLKDCLSPQAYCIESRAVYYLKSSSSQIAISPEKAASPYIHRLQVVSADVPVM